MTRIASVKPHPISVPLKDVLWTAHEELKSSSVIVRNPLSHHLLVGGVETRDSFVHLNDEPGFGVGINWDYAKRYAA